MSDVVPDDVLRDILSRLSVAPLLRFRCVSKSWKGLIDSDQFIKHHLNHSRKTNSNLNIILLSHSHVYLADFELLNDSNHSTFQKLSYPLKTPSSGIKTVGSCDGLLVLRSNIDDNAVLWNPSIRRFHVIPCSDIEYAAGYGDKKEFYGFGFDVVSDDYKLIRIVPFFGKEDTTFTSRVQVYSLKSGSWRCLPDFPYYISTDGQLANGALHWITGKVQSDYLVVAFDLGTEEFRLVPLPSFAGDVSPRMYMVVLGGCLSLVCYDANENFVDVWVMKEYGVEESWSILFTYNTSDLHFLRPIAYSKCGRKLLIDWGGPVFMWYDLDDDSIDIPMLEMPSVDTQDINTCVQSLVLVNKGTSDFDVTRWDPQTRT